MPSGGPQPPLQANRQDEAVVHAIDADLAALHGDNNRRMSVPRQAHASSRRVALAKCPTCLGGVQARRACLQQAIELARRIRDNSKIPSVFASSSLLCNQAKDTQELVPLVQVDETTEMRAANGCTVHNPLKNSGDALEQRCLREGRQRQKRYFDLLDPASNLRL